LAKNHLCSTALAALLAVAATAPIHAQDASPTTKSAVTPLKVTVTISRFQGEKRLSSLPYTLSVNIVPGERSNVANLRMGTRVPVTTTTAPKDGGTPTSSFKYENVGTSIDLFVNSADEGKFRRSSSR
jgi:hypothetical protein